jgi:hypothetical protein
MKLSNLILCIVVVFVGNSLAQQPTAVLTPMPSTAWKGDMERLNQNLIIAVNNLSNYSGAK